MKSSTISNSFLLAGSTLGSALVERIMPAPVYRGTFNTIVAAALALVAEPALVIVNTRLRKVWVAPASVALSEAVDGEAFTMNNGVYREVLPSNPDDRSAGIIVKELDPTDDSLGDTVTSGVTVPNGQTAFDAALDASLGAQDTAKSLGTLADAIADACEAEGKYVSIVFDQLAQKCRFYAFPVGQAQSFGEYAIMIAAEADSVIAEFTVAVPEVTSPVGFFGV